MTYTLFVGIDIAAASASVMYGTSADDIVPAFTIDQTVEGYTELRQRLQATGHMPDQTLVVMEATGTYWMQLAFDLQAAGFVVSVINPAKAHHFAQALLKRSKSDIIDAHTLTQLAISLKPDCWSPPPVVYEALNQCLTQRDELIDLLTQVRNQHHARQHRGQSVEAVAQRTQQLIDLLKTQIQALDQEIKKLLREDETLAADAARLQSITGIGTITAGWLLVATRSFSQADTPEQVASYAGLVPRTRQSGTSINGRGRIGHTGHSRLRTALYMATLSATRFNPIIRSFYQRLLKRGKIKKVALCAAARKLVHIAWAVVKKEQMFDPNYQHSALAA